MSRDTQKTLVEKVKNQFPGFTQAIASAGKHPERSGVQYTVALRRAAGMPTMKEIEKRKISNRYYVRLTDRESVKFDRFCENTGQDRQTVIRSLILQMIGDDDE